MGLREADGEPQGLTFQPQGLRGAPAWGLGDLVLPPEMRSQGIGDYLEHLLTPSPL